MVQFPPRPPDNFHYQYYPPPPPSTPPQRFSLELTLHIVMTICTCGFWSPVLLVCLLIKYLKHKQQSKEEAQWRQWRPPQAVVIVEQEGSPYGQTGPMNYNTSTRAESEGGSQQPDEEPTVDLQIPENEEW